MYRSITVRSVALFLAVSGGAAAGAQTAPIVYGTVRNDRGAPLRGVRISIARSSLAGFTNDSGVYRIDGLSPGRTQLDSRVLGFRPQEKKFLALAGSAHREDFELETVPQPLDTLLVMGRESRGRMAEFWARRATGVGEFITRADIEHRRPSRISDILWMVPGVNVVGDDDGTDRTSVVMGRNPVPTLSTFGRRSAVQLAADCRVNYYVDGMWMTPGTFSIDDIAPVSVEAIEIYRGPSETPARFRQRETACGLIVIWSREPPPLEKDPPGG